MKRCRWKSFFENPKPVVSNVEPSAIQKRPRRPKWLGLSIIAFVLVVAVAAAEAQQQPKIPKIGWLGARSFSGPDSRQGSGAELFVAEFSKLGYVDGKNVKIEYRYADGKFDRLPALADELVHLKVDLLMAGCDSGGLSR